MVFGFGFFLEKVFVLCLKEKDKGTFLFCFFFLRNCHFLDLGGRISGPQRATPLFRNPKSTFGEKKVKKKGSAGQTIVFSSFLVFRVAEKQLPMIVLPRWGYLPTYLLTYLLTHLRS